MHPLTYNTRSQLEYHREQPSDSLVIKTRLGMMRIGYLDTTLRMIRTSIFASDRGSIINPIHTLKRALFPIALYSYITSAVVQN